MSANIRETRIAMGFKKQSALQTAQVAADMWSLTKINNALAVVDLKSESDANDIGKGDEFAANNYLTNWDTNLSIEKYLSSECAAHAFVFGLGKTTKSTPDTGAFQYLCVPLDPVADEIEMPSFTYAEAIRQGGSSVIDRALIGVVIEEFQIALSSGPGRANAKMTVNAVGCGKNVSPSTITIPAVTAEHFLNSSGAAVTIIGVDYVTNKNLISANFGFKNNLRLDSGFYIGSGVNQGAAIRGRMEHGDRVANLSFLVRMASTSLELTKLLAQTEGTFVLTLTGALITGTTYHSLSATFHRIVYSAAVVGDADGIVDVAVTCQPMKHTSNGLLTFTAICAQDNIGTASS